MSTRYLILVQAGSRIQAGVQSHLYWQKLGRFSLNSSELCCVCYFTVLHRSTAQILIMLFCGELLHTVFSSFSIRNIAPSHQSRAGSSSNHQPWLNLPSLCKSAHWVFFQEKCIKCKNNFEIINLTIALSIE